MVVVVVVVVVTESSEAFLCFVGVPPPPPTPPPCPARFPFCLLSVTIFLLLAKLLLVEGHHYDCHYCHGQLLHSLGHVAILFLSRLPLLF